MTKEELENKARRFAEEQKENCILDVYDSTDDLEYDKCYNCCYVSGLEDGYIAGAKDNMSKWHKITDGVLPPRKTLVLIHAYDCTMLGWLDDTDIWHHDSNGDIIKKDYIYAWCEIPHLNTEE